MPRWQGQHEVVAVEGLQRGRPVRGRILLACPIRRQDRALQRNWSVPAGAFQSETPPRIWI